MSTENKEGRRLDLPEEEERRLIKEEFDKTLEGWVRPVFTEYSPNEFATLVTNVICLLSVIAR